MTLPDSTLAPASRGTFRFVNVIAGSHSHRSVEINTDATSTVTDLHPNTTEEELRAQLVADGYLEIDRDGALLDPQKNILQNEKAGAARAIIDRAISELAALGLAAFNQPIVSPVDGCAGWFLIVGKNADDVTSLRALLTAGCDASGADRAVYVRALQMIALNDS